MGFSSVGPTALSQSVDSSPFDCCFSGTVELRVASPAAEEQFGLNRWRELPKGAGLTAGDVSKSEGSNAEGSAGRGWPTCGFTSRSQSKGSSGRASEDGWGRPVGNVNERGETAGCAAAARHPGEEVVVSFGKELPPK